MIKLTRKTTESKITVSIEEPPLKKDYRQSINTPLVFLNHMIEQIAWRSSFNIKLNVELDKFILHHVICEDAGQAIGKAFKEYIDKNSVIGYGNAIGIIDEARAFCGISFEGRALFVIDKEIDLLDAAEDMKTEDLEVFFDAFAQGAGCTLQLDLNRGDNSHHIWEAAFRAFGTALSRALTKDALRENMTAGVAGRVEYTVE